MIIEHAIGLARPDDAAAIATLSRRSIEQGLSWRWTPERVLNSMGDAATNVIVARQGGDVLGFAIMKYGDDVAHVLLLAAQRRCRRQGIGSSLLAWLEVTARVAGATEIRLEARSSNAPAQAFYRRHGFVETERRIGYYEGVEDAVRLIKQLRSMA